MASKRGSTAAGALDTGSLVLKSLTIAYPDRSGEPQTVVADVDLELQPGKIIGLLGESGCGKSTTGLSLMGQPAITGIRLGGTATLDGKDLYQLPPDDVRRLWGRRLAYVSQSAGTALNPVRSIAFQLEEPLRRHLGLSRDAATTRAIELLTSVGIPEPVTALRRFPHQFSGGQQQRIGLAITTACKPQVLILDEPTSGLDVTTRAEINELIKHLVEETDAAALYISHDLSALGSLCETIVVMYAGEIVERGPAKEVLAQPRHPYTAALLDAVPRVDEEQLAVGIPGRPPQHVVRESCAYSARCRFQIDECRTKHPILEAVQAGRDVRCLRARELGAIAPERLPNPRSRATLRLAPFLELTDITCRYGDNIAVDDVSLQLSAAEAVGIVGESGSGKTTLLKAIAGLHPPTAGVLEFAGRELPAGVTARPRELRQAIQLVFQSADTSLNPRQSVAQILARPLALFRPEVRPADRRGASAQLLADVRMDPDVLDRRPHELSGGQRQRVALARAFAAGPKLLLCDEVVSALDVSVAASVLELLITLVDEHNTAMIFVTHNLAIVRAMTDRILVMKDGKIVEQGPTADVLDHPTHPYTEELLAAARAEPR